MDLMDQTLDIFIDELVANEDFRDSFLRSPRQALQRAGDWGLPFADSEIRRLLSSRPAVWDRVAEELGSRLELAA